MRRNFKRRYFIIFVFLLCTFVSGRVLKLKSGETIEGTIVTEAEEHYLFSTGYGKVRILKDSISKKKPSENDTAAELLKKGKEHLDSTDPYEMKKAFESIRKSAVMGNVEARYILATLYHTGQGDEISRTRAYKWYRKAAAGGNLKAELILAMLIESGKMPENRPGEMEYWYRKAAEAGDIVAQYKLGRILHKGINREKKIVDAVKWYRKAAENGSLGAQYTLARLYYYGKGVPIDYNKALKWYFNAAQQGDLISKYMVALIHLKGLTGKKNMKKAFFWLKQSASLPRAMYRLARMYWYGQGTSMDREKARILIGELLKKDMGLGLLQAVSKFNNFMKAQPDMRQ